MSQPIVFSPAELLTFSTVSSELNRFSSILKAHPDASFEFDLSQVIQCDTAGLAFLIEVKRLCVLKENGFLVKKMPNMMVDLATFCGVNNLFLGV
jgi:phospholipid transport system transporter-binding protein